MPRVIWTPEVRESDPITVRGRMALHAMKTALKANKREKCCKKSAWYPSRKSDVAAHGFQCDRAYKQADRHYTMMGAK